MSLGWAVTGAPPRHRSAKVLSPRGKALNPCICKETQMDTADHTQSSSNRERNLDSHHTPADPPHKPRNNTRGPILFPLRLLWCAGHKCCRCLLQHRLTGTHTWALRSLGQAFGAAQVPCPDLGLLPCPGRGWFSLFPAGSGHGSFHAMAWAG